MTIRPPHAKGADTGTARPVVGAPGPQRRIDIERAVGKINFWVRLGIVQGGGQSAMVQRQHRLDQARHASGFIQMAEIGLNGTNRAELHGQRDQAAPLLECLCQRGHLDRIAEPCPRAMCFNVTNCGWIHLGHGQRIVNHRGLAGNTGGRKANFTRAIVVNRRPLDQREDRVTSGQRLTGPLEHHHPCPAAKDRAGGGRIKGATVAVRRTNHALFIEIAILLWHTQGDTAGQR